MRRDRAPCRSRLRSDAAARSSATRCPQRLGFSCLPFRPATGRHRILSRVKDWDVRGNSKNRSELLGLYLMGRLTPWDQQIGRRLRLRDLFLFLTVAECGSMGKAAAKLGISTPSISEVMAGLEHAVGARLLDRNPKGVVLSPYGEALLVRARAAFDELHQGIRDIEFIGDPHAGELTIGCPESITAGFLLPVLRQLTSLYPRVRYHVRQVQQPTVEYPELQDRQVDLVLARCGNEPPKADTNELDVEFLFNDPYFLVVSQRSKWARRRKLDLAELVGGKFIVPPIDAWGGALVADAFKQRGLD